MQMLLDEFCMALASKQRTSAECSVCASVCLCVMGASGEIKLKNGQMKIGKNWKNMKMPSIIIRWAASMPKKSYNKL